MLISIVMDPTCLAPEILSYPEALSGAETLLRGVIDNGVLLTSDSSQYARSLALAASNLEPKMGQQIQLFITEIAKNPKMFVAAEHSRHSGSTRSMELSQLQQLALALSADIVVCRDVHDVGSLSDLCRYDIEVCTLSDYGSSNTESRRWDWCHAKRIDNLSPGQSGEMIGRTLRYATEIVVVDRYVAEEAVKVVKAGKVSEQLELFARGLIYVANCWKKHSPYAHYCRPTIHLISVVNSFPAARGVDLKTIKKTIWKAVSQLDSKSSVGKFQVSLKIDKNPRIVKDRFVAGMGRCFGVQHGLDDIGKLASPRSRKGPTSLIPDSQDYRDLLTAITTLPSAQ